MGVIRWIEDDHTDTMGFLGKLHICTIEDIFNEHGHKWLVYKAAFPGHLPEYKADHRFPCHTEEVARQFAEGCLQEWLDQAGLVPKPSYAEPLLPLIWRRKQIGNRMVSTGYIGKTEVCHVFDPGYHGVTCWIARVLQSFPGGPSTVSTADIFATAEEAKDTVQQLYDRFLLETCLQTGAA